MMWLLLTAVALVLWAGLLWTAAGDAMDERPAGSDCVELLAQVLIVERDGPRVTLNCVTAQDLAVDGGGEIAAGTPFVVMGELPQSEAWAGAAAAYALKCWSSSGESVDLAIVPGAAGPSIELSSGKTTIRLPMAA